MYHKKKSNRGSLFTLIKVIVFGGLVGIIVVSAMLYVYIRYLKKCPSGQSICYNVFKKKGLRCAGPCPEGYEYDKWRCGCKRTSCPNNTIPYIPGSPGESVANLQEDGTLEEEVLCGMLCSYSDTGYCELKDKDHPPLCGYSRDEDGNTVNGCFDREDKYGFCSKGDSDLICHPQMCPSAAGIDYCGDAPKCNKEMYICSPSATSDSNNYCQNGGTCNLINGYQTIGKCSNPEDQYKLDTNCMDSSKQERITETGQGTFHVCDDSKVGVSNLFVQCANKGVVVDGCSDKLCELGDGVTKRVGMNADGSDAGWCTQPTLGNPGQNAITCCAGARRAAQSCCHEGQEPQGGSCVAYSDYPILLVSVYTSSGEPKLTDLQTEKGLLYNWSNMSSKTFSNTAVVELTVESLPKHIKNDIETLSLFPKDYKKVLDSLKHQSLSLDETTIITINNVTFQATQANPKDYLYGLACQLSNWNDILKNDYQLKVNTNPKNPKNPKNTFLFLCSNGDTIVNADKFSYCHEAKAKYEYTLENEGSFFKITGGIHHPICKGSDHKFYWNNLGNTEGLALAYQKKMTCTSKPPTDDNTYKHMLSYLQAKGDFKNVKSINFSVDNTATIDYDCSDDSWLNYSVGKYDTDINGNKVKLLGGYEAGNDEECNEYKPKADILKRSYFYDPSTKSIMESEGVSKGFSKKTYQESTMHCVPEILRSDEAGPFLLISGEYCPNGAKMSKINMTANDPLPYECDLPAATFSDVRGIQRRT